MPSKVDIALGDLTTRISAVYNYIATSCVGARITGEVQIYPLELTRISIPLQWSKSVPFLLHLKGAIFADRCVDVARTDGIDTGESGPLYGQ